MLSKSGPLKACTISRHFRVAVDCEWSPYLRELFEEVDDDIQKFAFLSKEWRQTV
jgi:hypothetical protein